MKFIGDPRFMHVISHQGEKLILRVDCIASVRENDKGGATVTFLPETSYLGEIKLQTSIEEVSALLKAKE
ncbi:hypothetical protein [Maricaulis sp.]|uniref:hypothetical protein n=1 Tax=Maricaulis sp. TaxID=1486257 RepID=UPI0026046145|nr:hypothetical protein [Maricaulis sp.]